MSLAVVIVIVSATFLKRYTLQPSPGHPLILQERCFVLSDCPEMSMEDPSLAVATVEEEELQQ